MGFSRQAKDHLRQYGISKGQARAAHPVREGVTAPWGETYSLHVREPTAWEPFYIVSIVEDGTGQVQGVHVVPDNDFLPATEGRRPLKLLRRLLGQYRLPASVWGHGGFYLVPDVTDGPHAPAKGEKNVSVREENPDAVVQDLTRFSMDNGLQIFMAFAVDAAAVREAVESEEE